MTPERYARVKGLFLAAIELPPGERDPWLEKACAGDSSLRGEVEALLAHQTAEAATPNHPAAGTTDIGRGADATTKRGIGNAVEAQTGTLRSSPNLDPIDDAIPERPPGTIIAGRYRIVSRLGVGGMGIVYRAEDLTLSQAVALKFLPPAVAANSVWLARFRNEARLARSITHPNVCRVHDIAKADGEHFITMEFVPGEDLAHLLRRIGRLSPAKAVDIARQICFGLAAAHRAGVLHRDLKPANIMLDADGNARITDFGIAGLSGHIAAGEIRAGTPAYMAPEQITGRDVTSQSDLYALGLVLYELFSGCPAFQATCLDEYLQLHENATPRPLSEIVTDLPDKVEEIVNRCVEKNPNERPKSAMHVAAALPGTDVLRVALESGVTPSPDLIAAAPAGGRRIRHRWRLAFIGTALLASLVVLRSTYPLQWDNLGTNPPAALAERARQILKATGLAIPEPHEAFGYCTTEDAWRPMTQAFASPDIDGKLAPDSPSEPCFFYRQSDHALIPVTMENLFWRAGYVTPGDPPLADANSRAILFDKSGRLILFGATAGDVADGSDSANVHQPNNAWSEIVRAAGIGTTQLGTPGAPETNAQDREGCTYLSARPIRQLEGSTTSGVGCWSGDRVTFFATGSQRGEPSQQVMAGFSLLSGQQRAVAMVQRVLFLLLVAIAVPLGIRRYGSGKPDYPTAVRLAAIIVLFETLAALLRLGSSASFYDSVSRLSVAVVRGAGIAGLLGVSYVAVDGFARRHWPHLLVTWNRSVLGRVADVDVRSHTLVGVCVGCWWSLIASAERAVVGAFGLSMRPMFSGDHIAEKLHGFGAALAGYCGCARQSLLFGLLFLLLLVVIRALIRHSTWAVAVCAVLLASIAIPRGANSYTALLAMGLGVAAVGAWIMSRFGLLTIVVAIFVATALNSTPLNVASRSWTAGYSVFVIVIVAGLTAWGATGRLVARN